MTTTSNYYKNNPINNSKKLYNNWIPRNITMNNLATVRASVMSRQLIASKVEVPDELVTKRALPGHAFRESYFNEFRYFLEN